MPIRDYAKTIPCPFCYEERILIEKAIIYDGSEDGYICRCSHCNAITIKAKDEKEAIYNWEFEKFTPLTWMLAMDGHTKDPEKWKNLNNAIVEQAFRDLKSELKKDKGLAIMRKEKEWFLSDDLKHFTDIPGNLIIRAAEAQVKYDNWRYKTGCAKCNRKTCEHFKAYRWKMHAQGKALCMKELKDGRSVQATL